MGDAALAAFSSDPDAAALHSLDLAHTGVTADALRKMGQGARDRGPTAELRALDVTGMGGLSAGFLEEAMAPLWSASLEWCVQRGGV